MTAHEKIERARALFANLIILGQLWRAVWVGDDGEFRCGHSGDMRTMLDDLRSA